MYVHSVYRRVTYEYAIKREPSLGDWMVPSVPSEIASRACVIPLI